MAYSDPHWIPEPTPAVMRLSVQDRFLRAVERVRYYDAQTRMSDLGDLPSIPDSGCPEEELDRLEKTLGIALPREYRKFLGHWTHLTIYDGFAVWGPRHHELWVEDNFFQPDHRFLVCGDCWLDANGDQLLLDLDTPGEPVAVWCHDRREVRPVAPSFSLALSAIVDFILAPEHLNAVIEQDRAYVVEALARRERPWWRRVF